MKRTKIVCTIGPTSDKKATLKRLIKSGMNVARLNFSHNVHAYHFEVLKRVRALGKELKQPVGVLVDLQGPRIRLGDLPEKGVKLVRGKKVVFTTAEKVKKGQIDLTYKDMHRDVKKGERILISDGLIELKIEKVSGSEITAKVINGGVVTSHKGINLPDTDVKIAAISDKDRLDAEFAVKNKADFVALSFVRRAKDVHDLRKLLATIEKRLSAKGGPAYGGKNQKPIMIIVKIERKEAVDNFDEILAACDGVMVARGDLGTELGVAYVPIIQKMIIDKCIVAAKPVIVATQMLESMINSPRPTRAEASDVANAVIDHTDAVMLSGETASGKFPVEAVKMMKQIVENTEQSVYDDYVLEKKAQMLSGEGAVMGQVAKLLSENTKTKLILGATMSGHTGRVLSRFRPETDIYMACTEDRIKNQLSLSWGVRPFSLSLCRSLEELTTKGKNYLKKIKVVRKDDQIIIVAGVPVQQPGRINLVEIQKI
jgi:pyruvate kinase